MTKTCDYCGKTYKTAYNNQHYCCLECSAAGARLKRTAWEITHPGYNAAYSRVYRANRKHISDNT